MRPIRKIDVCGMAYTVCRVERGEDLPDGAKDGHIDTNKCLIVLARGMHPTRDRDNLVHELVHGILDASGVWNVIEQATTLDGSALEDLEERIVRPLTPALITTFRQLPHVFSRGVWK